MGVFRKNSNWWIDYYEPDGTRARRKIGPNKRTAENALAKTKTLIAEGKYLDKKVQIDDIGLRAMTDKFMGWSKTDKRSWKRDELCVKHLLAHFGDGPLAAISPFAVEGYKRARHQQVSNRTVNIELACLKNMFNKAVKWGDAQSNPVNAVDMLQEPQGRVRYLAEDEIRRLLAACKDHMYSIVLTALHTGMRRGEILSLTWEQVDLRRGEVHVVQSKNGEGRVIPMTAALKEELGRLHADRCCNHVFTTMLKPRRPMKDIRSAWEGTLKRAGITEFRFHDLRHTAASYLVMSGVDLRTVQEILGHKTFAMTQRYSHLSPQHKTKAISRLDSAIPAGREGARMGTDGHHMDTGGNLLTLPGKRNI